MDLDQEERVSTPVLETAEETLDTVSDSEPDANQSETGDETESDEAGTVDQQIRLAQDFSPISKIPWVFVVDNKKRAQGGSVRYPDLTLDAKGSHVFQLICEINGKLIHMLLDDNALGKALLVAPELQDVADDLVADKPGTLRTLHLPAEAMDGFSREQQRNFANWLHTSVEPSDTRLHLILAEKRKAILHEDAKYALCMLVDGKDKQFCRYLSARPEMIDDLAKFPTGNGIFTWHIISQIAPQISENYIGYNLYHDSHNLRRLAHSVYLWLKEEFGKKPSDKGQRNILFNRKVELVLSCSASDINPALTRSDKFKVFGLIYGSIQGGALRHMGHIQKKETMRNKMIGKTVASLVTAGLLIPGIFCAHWGGILLSLGAAFIQPWVEEGAKKVANKTMPPTKWFTFMYRAVEDQLDDLESWVREHHVNTPDTDVNSFIYYSRLGLKKGLPNPKFNF
ncbi:hypothetical protein APSETT445_007000 [Aspergillus pseudonomiae]